MFVARLAKLYLEHQTAAKFRIAFLKSFTGFARDDDAPIARLRGTRPFHVVNVTLNLVQTTRLAWQQRKAASFTVTPLHCGSSELGYRDASLYGGGKPYAYRAVIPATTKVAEQIAPLQATSGHVTAGIAETSGTIGKLDEVQNRISEILEEQARMADSLRGMADAAVVR